MSDPIHSITFDRVTNGWILRINPDDYEITKTYVFTEHTRMLEYIATMLSESGEQD